MWPGVGGRGGDSGGGAVQVSGWEYDTICNGHGPMLRYNMEELVGDYRDWSAALGKAPASVAVLYLDNYGFCDRLSQQLARGIVKANIATEMVDMVRPPTTTTPLALPCLPSSDRSPLPVFCSDGRINTPPPLGLPFLCSSRGGPR